MWDNNKKTQPIGTKKSRNLVGQQQKKRNLLGQKNIMQPLRTKK